MTDERGNYFEKRAGTDDARYHVVPGDKKDWAVKEEGKNPPLNTFDNKDDAIEDAKKRAEEAGSKAIIHSDSGEIEDQIEYDQ